MYLPFTFYVSYAAEGSTNPKTGRDRGFFVFETLNIWTEITEIIGILRPNEAKIWNFRDF